MNKHKPDINSLSYSSQALMWPTHVWRIKGVRMSNVYLIWQGTLRCWNYSPQANSIMVLEPWVLHSPATLTGSKPCSPITFRLRTQTTQHCVAGHLQFTWTRHLHQAHSCAFLTAHDKEQWKQWETLFFWAPKPLQMVTAAMKLEDTFSLEEKVWPTSTAY